MAITGDPQSFEQAVPRARHLLIKFIAGRIKAKVDWILTHPEVFLVLAILLLVGVAHGTNMYSFPYVEDDEGTYESQAWAVVHFGRLAVYTYWYDHAPLGWIQIGIWSVLTGGFHAFGSSANSGRMFMWFLSMVSTFLVYAIAKRISGSMLVGMVAALLSALTAYGGFFERRVLLDCITIPWMLASLYLLVGERPPTLARLFSSSCFLAISILSKEVTAFLIPALTIVALGRIEGERRLLAALYWMVPGALGLSVYVLMAKLDGELFPTGTRIGVSHGQPSLFAIVALIPALAMLLARKTSFAKHHPNAFAWWIVVSILMVFFSAVSLIMSTFFAKGILVGGLNAHVSLLGTLAFQGARSGNGGIMSPHSAIRIVGSGWMRDEPYLVFGGTACALISIILGTWFPRVGIVGLMTFSLWAFMARGGEVIEFYLVPLLPLLALNIALVFGVGISSVRSLIKNPGLKARWFGGVLKACATLAVLSGLLLGYLSPDRGYKYNHLLLWTSTQADAQGQALAWVGDHIDPSSHIMMDNYAFQDLHDGSLNHRAYTQSQYYWKIANDPAISQLIFHGQWQYADWVIYTIQMQTDLRLAGLTLPNAIVAHSRTLAEFNTGGWPVTIMQVMKPGMTAPDTLLPTTLAPSLYLGGTSTDHVASLISMLNPSTLPASVQLTFLFTDGTVTHAGVVVDASSRKVVAATSVQSHSGSFALLIQTDRPVVSYMLHDDTAGGTSLSSSTRIAKTWSLTWNSAAQPLPRTVDILNPDPTRVATIRVMSASSTQLTTVRVNPHSEYVIDSALAMTSGMRLSSDVPVAVQDSTRVGAYQSSQATFAYAGRNYMNLTDSACQATIAGAYHGDPARLIVAHCPTDWQMNAFVHRMRVMFIGTQIMINQTEFPGTIGNETTGSVRFGEGTHPMF